MVRLHVNRHIVVVALLLIGSIFVSFRALADPAVNDNLNGTKTARWDFWDPANYTTSNVAMSPGNLTLASTPGSWPQTSDLDFTANGTPDPTIRIVNGSIRLAGNEANLVANGDFSQASNWTWTNGTPGTVVAHQVLGAAEFLHASANNSTQLDSMDTGAGWSSATSGIGAISTVTLNLTNKVEGTGAVRDAISLNLPSMWAGITTASPVWDLSPYNKISVWLQTNFSGPLSAILHLQSSQAGPPVWDSNPVTLTTSWQRREFDITPFGSNLSTVNRIDLRFTGSQVNSVNVFVDDVWLLFRKSLDGTARISQSFVKPTTSNGQPGSVLLRWDAQVAAVTNVSAAQLNITVINGTGSFQRTTISVTAPRSWTTERMDVSTLLAPAGTYTVRIDLRVAIDTHLATDLRLEVDNVTLMAPDYQDGGYVSIPLDAGSAAVWGQVDWTKQDDSETSVSVLTRSGSTPTPGPAWSNWKPHSFPEPIGCPEDRYLQFRILLHTSNSSRTPALFDINLHYSRFSPAGSVQSLPFLPPEYLLAWQRFDVNDSTRAGTSIAYEDSVDGTNWIPVVSGSDLSGLAPTSVQIRASLATTNTSRTMCITFWSVTCV